LVPPFFLLLTAHCLLGAGVARKSKKRKKGRGGFKLDFLGVGGPRGKLILIPYLF
jgi:hypothetical protein